MAGIGSRAHMYVEGTAQSSKKTNTNMASLIAESKLKAADRPTTSKNARQDSSMSPQVPIVSTCKSNSKINCSGF